MRRFVTQRAMVNGFLLEIFTLLTLNITNDTVLEVIVTSSQGVFCCTVLTSMCLERGVKIVFPLEVENIAHFFNWFLYTCNSYAQRKGNWNYTSNRY
jgi:hypothetical protein